MESGRNPDRSELAKAIRLARLTGGTLVIARLDRLSRNAAFLLTLRDSGVRFLACAMPEANDLTVGIMALVAQAERDAISRRTKEALAAAKARGAILGNPNGAAAGRQGGAALRATVAQNADADASALADVIADLRLLGHTSPRALATELNALDMVARRARQAGIPGQVCNHTWRPPKTGLASTFIEMFHQMAAKTGRRDQIHSCGKKSTRSGRDDGLLRGLRA